MFRNFHQVLGSNLKSPQFLPLLCLNINSNRVAMFCISWILKGFTLYLRKRKFYLIFIYLALLCLWCEILVFYFKFVTSCSWPLLVGSTKDSQSLKLLVLSDTHLLGKKKGHWFDKLRREWQMYISFQTAVYLYKPEYVIFLGDILDEGQIANYAEFDSYTRRFYEVFSHDEDVKQVVIVGNHDIGFHDRVVYFEPLLRRRFEKAFNSSFVEAREINGVTFVALNSMALENDGCGLCNRAMRRIEVIGRKLRAEKRRPILLLHFPLYRISDEKCQEIDSDTSPGKKNRFVEGIDCVSKDSTEFILRHLQPRLVLSGHTHHGCVTQHTIDRDSYTQEWTVASFSWRNRPSPSFLLAKISAEDFAISRCMIPNEFYVVFTYAVGFLILAYFFFKNRGHYF